MTLIGDGLTGRRGRDLEQQDAALGEALLAKQRYLLGEDWK